MNTGRNVPEERLLKQSDEFETDVRDVVLQRLAEDGVKVLKYERGNREDLAFDWLFWTEDGCIGLEVTRAEDKEQLDHIEEGMRSEAEFIDGTAEMPWDSVARAANRKLERIGAYREQINRLECASSQLHLAIPSLGQDLKGPEVSEAVWDELEGALHEFDAVWIIQGDLVEMRRGSRTEESDR